MKQPNIFLGVGRKMAQTPLQHIYRDLTQLPLNSFFITLGKIFHLCAFGGSEKLLVDFTFFFFLRTLLHQYQNWSYRSLGKKHIALLRIPVSLKKERKERCGETRNWDREHHEILYFWIDQSLPFRQSHVLIFKVYMPFLSKHPLLPFSNLCLLKPNNLKIP